MLKRLLSSAAALLPRGAQAGPALWIREWPETDFSRSLINDWSQIRPCGVARDGIEALDSPDFLNAASMQGLSAREPVIALEIQGAQPRAYPLRYLMKHEIVNDEAGGVPVAVTYCPLCNSAMVFDRRTSRGVLSFGVAGPLRYSDLVMYDRETHSWWQQANGRGLVGTLSGQQLAALPGWVESWQEFRDRNPQGLVMAQPERELDYEKNPHPGYDSSVWPFRYDGPPPPHGMAPMARVVRCGSAAWPLERLRQAGELRENGLRLSWRAGQSSPLDTSSVAEGRDVGTVRVRDEAGLDVPYDVLFAFAFNAFWPKGRWRLG